MYALVDCNNFYASCERLFKPGLIGKPVVVLSNNDGCVIARSNEAKALGVKMGVPLHEIKDLIALHGIYVFSSNYELYGNLSGRVMSILNQFSPEIEIYSIDEAFMKFNGFSDDFDLQKCGVEIHKKIKKWVGIPVSVGFAPTKALAKIANKIAKKYPEQTGSSYVIDSEEKRIKALKWTAIGDVWGVGRQYEKLLLSKNIKTAYQFTEMHDDVVRRLMKVTGLQLKHDLEGITTIGFEDVQDKKSMACTRSFEKMHNDLDNIAERASTFCAILGEKLRIQKSHCNVITIFIISNSFRTDLEQHRSLRTIKTDYPTNSTLEINRIVQAALKTMFKPGIYYKKAGVIVGDLTPADCFQLKFFGGESPKHIDLMRTIDKLNRKTGGKVKFGHNDLTRRHKMLQKNLSNCYTTRFSELLTINLE